ncbi:hypothetical protein ELQ92_06335 [Labedella populi]|uniref:DUF4190 domain-containing protein n=1 Tax=Labedella populi TaxID=2498850 RepID=A0A444QCJ7_9MICO|nr:hypothetical protein [Labedella populi]RWZ64384.1 hypothetical protein ELQ92_06335 [Labedella populi]
MSDPRFPSSEQPPSDAPSFAAPSEPGFAPGPPHAANGRGTFGDPAAGWPAAGTVPFTPHRRSASRTAIAAFVLSIVGALVGLAIGWGFPLSIAGLVLALRGRRGPGPSRTLATWSIVLAAVSGLSSVGWLAYSLVSLLA